MADVVDVLDARIGIDGGVGAMGEPLGVAPLLVEAYVSLGRVADAEDLTRRLAGATPEHAPAELSAMVLRCQGLVARRRGGGAAIVRRRARRPTPPRRTSSSTLARDSCSAHG